jgi:hypothetical protein
MKSMKKNYYFHDEKIPNLFDKLKVNLWTKQQNESFYNCLFLIMKPSFNIFG